MKHRGLLPALLCCLLAATCGDQGVIDVSVIGLSDDIRSLQVQPAGLPAQGVYSHLSSFRVRFAAGTTKIDLRVDGIGPDGCALASGQGTLVLDGPGPFSMEIALARLAEAERGCRLVVEQVGAGSLTVTSLPAGIDCGPGCARRFPLGTVVDLIAHSATARLGAWSGDCAGQSVCRVTIGGGTTRITASLAARPPVVVAKDGLGTGVVTSDPPGIDCGKRCSAVFTAGTPVKLSFSPDSAQCRLGRWSAPCSGNGECVFIAGDQPMQITASLLPPTVKGAYSVWGISSRDIWLSDSKSVLTWTGAYWAESEFPSLPGFPNVFWGSAASDVWAAGRDGAIRHWKGTGWLPVVGSLMGPPLYAIWGSGARDIWAVGPAGTRLHYTGSTWSPSPPDTVTTELHGVWGSGPQDVWAVGLLGTIVRWTGSSWGVPTFTGTMAALLGIWGSAPNDVWVVGDRGTILHWNGSAWGPVPSGTTQILNGVWGSGPQDVWAVGMGGTILRWSGTSWAPVPTAGIFGEELMHLDAIWGSGPGDIWVTVDNTYTFGDYGSLLHWDGKAWALFPQD